MGNSASTSNSLGRASFRAGSTGGAGSRSCSKSRKCVMSNSKESQNSTKNSLKATDSISDNSRIMPTFGRSKVDNSDDDWTFVPPPNSQRTFFIAEDQLEISSEFDSGNLIQVERIGPFQYIMYNSMDCSNSAYQTNGRQWFHFSIRGGVKGANVSINMIGVSHSAMYTYEWAPVMAVFPSRPAYSRISGGAKVCSLKDMPATPGYPLLFYCDPALRHLSIASEGNLEPQTLASGIDGEEGTSDAVMISAAEGLSNQTLSPTSLSPFEVTNHMSLNGKFEDAVNSSPLLPNASVPITATAKKSTKKGFKKYVAMILEFEFTIEVDIPLKSPYPIGHPNCPAIYIASNHPYPYTTLQRNIYAWQRRVEINNRNAITRLQGCSFQREPVVIDTSPSTHEGGRFSASKTVAYAKAIEEEFPVMNHAKLPHTSGDGGTFQPQDIYFHREVLCHTLEGRRVDLLTISDMSGAKIKDPPMEMLSDEHSIPVSSAQGVTTRALRFSGKQYVVLSARVHAGECPASHMMHGCLEFLLNPKDPRARALRQNFVFFIVPMLNPDGVLRGHSRVDAAGVDLNRTYRNPSFKRHPATFSLWALLKSLNTMPGRLALFVDMHAHSNQRGIFFYGNSMDVGAQLQTLMYSQLVSINTPYLELKQCDFTESNMFATSRSGTSKNSSCRVALHTEAGVLHSYTLEASYVEGNVFTPMAPLSGALAKEDEVPEGQVSGKPRYTPKAFSITGKAILLGLLDLHALNPISRMPSTMFCSLEGLSLWMKRQLKIEVAERLFLIAHKAHGRVELTETDASPYVAIFDSLASGDIPDKITLKGCRALPPTTVIGVKSILSIPEVISLLEQTPPAGPPRSLVHDANRTRLSSVRAGPSSKRGENTAFTAD